MRNLRDAFVSSVPAAFRLGSAARVGGAAVLLAAALGVAGPAAHGQTPTGVEGSGLSFGLDLRVESDSNLALDPVSPGTTTQATARLSFEFRRETALDVFSFRAGGLLRAVDGPGGPNLREGFQDPNTALSYNREGANAGFRFSAFWRENEIEFLRSLEEFISTDTGLIVLPDDLDALRGTGKRIAYGADTSLSLRTATPLSFTLTAGFNVLDYVNATSPSLVPNKRWRVGASTRMILSPVTEATLGVQFSQFEQTGVAGSRRDTWGTNFGLARTLTNGSVRLNFGADMTPDGTRLTASVGRNIDLPNGGLSFSIGASRPANSTRIVLTGSMGYRHDYARGQLSADLRRAVVPASDDTDQLTTALSLRYRHEISDLSSLGLTVSYAITESTATGNTTQNTSLGLDYSRALTSDWSLNLGYRHRLREETGFNAADSDSVFLSLRRTFR